MGKTHTHTSEHTGTSLVVQRRRFHAPKAGSPGSIPEEGTRPRMLQLRPGAAKKKKNRIYTHQLPSSCEPGKFPGSHPVVRTLRFTAGDLGSMPGWGTRPTSCPHACVLSHFSQAPLFLTLWTVAHQTPLSVGSSGQEYWHGLPCPPPGDLPNPGIKPASPRSPALAGGFFRTNATWETPTSCLVWPKN